MRVITGIARGRKLEAPTGHKIRPTSDMVKEAIFSMIQFDLPGRRVLDLFAGTGQLGIEAISRGAAHCDFVDSSKDAIHLIRTNLEIAGFTQSSDVYQMTATGFLGREEKYDIVLLDPPYDYIQHTTLLQKAMEFDILQKSGIMVCEIPVGITLPEPIVPYTFIRESRFGKTKIIRFGKE